MTRGLGLDGKVVVVTGAGRDKGLGQGILKRFADEGCNCVASDILGVDAMSGIVDDLRARGAGAEAIQCDVTKEEDVRQLIDASLDAFGRIDIFINNAGYDNLMKPLFDTTVEDWNAVLDVNVMGVFLCTKYVAAQMLKQNKQSDDRQGGRIINIASEAAKSGLMHMSAYSASKHGVLGFTRACALELGRHAITVNAVCPNRFATETGERQQDYFSTFFGLSVKEYMAEIAAKNPMRRIGLVRDTAAACAFLASDQADYITGEALNVTGGEEMH